MNDAHLFCLFSHYVPSLKLYGIYILGYVATAICLSSGTVLFNLNMSFP